MAGVTPDTGSGASTPATGEFGRVGATRGPSAAVDGAAAAGELGLNVIADELDDVSVAAGTVEVDVALGVVAMGAVGFAAVSLADGGVLVVELQPGFAKIRIRAKRWMPTTMPKIFRIFIGGIGSAVVRVENGECYPKLPAGASRFWTRDSNWSPRSS